MALPQKPRVRPLLLALSFGMFFAASIEKRGARKTTVIKG
jgi:hypothetical protein